MKGMTESGRLLRVFLCHSAGDKHRVRELYQRLRSDGIKPWLDEQDLLPGQDWSLEIAKAVRNSDVVLVCCSRESINKAGFIQREIRFALDVADEQPENTIFIIPLRLEECEVPDRLRRWHWVNLFEESGYEKLMRALRVRASGLGLSVSKLVTPAPIQNRSQPSSNSTVQKEKEGNIWNSTVTIIVEALGINYEEVTPQSRIIEDLGADELDEVELLMAVEQEFGVDIPDEDANKIKTVAQLVDCIKRYYSP
jgi:acyl carrier protein